MKNSGSMLPAKLTLKNGYMPLGIIVITGAWLRLFQLDSNSLWVDEIGQILVSRNGVLAALVGASTHYGAAPLDYIVTSITLHLGTSEFALRLPAAVWGTLSIPLIYWFSRLLWQSIQVSLIAALLLAVTPSAVEFSQEVRWYSLSMMLALLSGCLCLYALSTKQSGVWILLSASFTLSVVTALFQVFVIAALGLSLVILYVFNRCVLQQKSTDFEHSNTLVPLEANYPPYNINLKDILNFSMTLIVPATFSIYWYMSGALRYDATGAFAFKPVPYPELSTYPLFGSYGAFLHPWPMHRELAGPIIFPLLFLVGTVAAMLHQRIAVTVPILTVTMTMLGILAVDYVSSYFWSYRQFLLIVPFYLSVVAFGVWSLSQLVPRKPLPQALMTATLLSALLWLTIPQLQDYYNYSKSNWRDTASILALASVDSENHIAIDTTWQPYVSYYAPLLRGHATDLSAIPIAEAEGEQSRIWFLGPRDTLAARVPATWELTTIAADPALPIYVASNTPAYDWLPDFTQAPLPPTTYQYGLLYTLASIDQELALETGDRIMESIRSRSTPLNARQRAEITAVVGRTKFDAGDTDTGVALLHEAVKYDTTSQEALETLGYALMHTGNQREAAKVFEQSIWHHPRSYWAHAFLASIYEAQLDWRKAAEYHVKAWELAYDLTMRVEQEKAADIAYKKYGDETARKEFERRVQRENLAGN